MFRNVNNFAYADQTTPTPPTPTPSQATTKKTPPQSEGTTHMTYNSIKMGIHLALCTFFSRCSMFDHFDGGVFYQSDAFLGKLEFFLNRTFTQPILFYTDIGYIHKIQYSTSFNANSKHKRHKQRGL